MANDTNTGGSDTFTIAASNLPTHTHSIGAHSHGLNSHKHSVGAHAHGLNSHKHAYDKTNTPTEGCTLTVAQIPSHNHKNYGYYNLAAGGDRKCLSWTKLTSDGASSNYTDTGGGGSHDHALKYTSTNSGAASGNTANSTAFDSGAASGSTANSTAFESGNGGFANEAISNLPAYQNLYA